MYQINPELKKELYALRETFHKHPELSLQEYWTTAEIVRYVEKLGLQIIDFGQETGVVAVLRTGKNGTMTGIRADIDALPVSEPAENAVCSQINGVMHACGHDTHITCALGAAKLLSQSADQLNGDVVFIFQPDEETSHGAKQLIKAGFFDKLPVKAIFSMHNRPDMNTGDIGIRTGPIMTAKDSFVITINGKGGHGSEPHKSVNPITCAAAMVNALNTIISCRVDPQRTAVISICSIQGGTADNIFPSDVTMMGNVRTDNNDIRARILDDIAVTAKNIAAAFRCTEEVQFQRSINVLINDESLLDIAKKSAYDVTDSTMVYSQDFDMVSEDFSEFASIVPCFYYFVGSAIESRPFYPLHSPYYMASDEMLPIGAALLAKSVINAQTMLK